MSKQLLKPSNLDEIKRGWDRLMKLRFNGICTNLPYVFLEFVKEMKYK